MTASDLGLVVVQGLAAREPTPTLCPDWSTLAGLIVIGLVLYGIGRSG